MTVSFFRITGVRPGMLLLAMGLPVMAQAATWSGHHVRGHEVRSFEPCQSEAVYWLRADPGVEQRLTAFVATLDAGPYPAVYLEFNGHPDDGPRPGLANGFDGVLVIERIVTLSTRAPETCPRPGKV